MYESHTMRKHVKYWDVIIQFGISLLFYKVKLVGLLGFGNGL